MAKLKEIKNLNNLLNNHLTELDGILQMQIKKIKNEYINNLIDEKIKLAFEICQGENLDFEQIKNKYFKSRDLYKYTTIDTNIEIKAEEELLDKILIDGKEYYYENKELGTVYDIDSNIVGLFKQGQIILN
jgi:hypothetical protein